MNKKALGTAAGRTCQSCESCRKRFSSSRSVAYLHHYLTELLSASDIPGSTTRKTQCLQAA
jgi:hypothetical protein